MNNYKCPICDKSGIGNFRKENIICPCCNNDLSIYRELSDSMLRPHRLNLKVIILTIVPIVILAVGISWICVSKHIDMSEQMNNKNLSQLKQLEIKIDSLEHLPPKEVIVTSSEFMYTVRKGDSYCLISRRFYGTESKASEIAESNNRTINASLTVGEKLIIK